MDFKKLKRSIRLLSIVLILCIGNCFRVLSNTKMRSVDIISLIALGMVIGGLIFAIKLYITYRKKEAEKLL